MSTESQDNPKLRLEKIAVKLPNLQPVQSDDLLPEDSQEADQGPPRMVEVVGGQELQPKLIYQYYFQNPEIGGGHVEKVHIDSDKGAVYVTFANAKGECTFPPLLLSSSCSSSSSSSSVFFFVIFFSHHPGMTMYGSQDVNIQLLDFSSSSFPLFSSSAGTHLIRWTLHAMIATYLASLHHCHRLLHNSLENWQGAVHFLSVRVLPVSYQ